MNKTFLIGRLTADPILRETQSGKSVCRFILAVDRMKKEDGADFISCTAWGRTAETLAKYMTKGSKIAVAGRIQTGDYEKDGRKIYTTDVVVNDLEFLDSKKKESETNAEAESEEYAVVPDDIDDSELPF